MYYPPDQKGEFLITYFVKNIDIVESCIIANTSQYRCGNRKEWVRIPFGELQLLIESLLVKQVYQDVCIYSLKPQENETMTKLIEYKNKDIQVTVQDTIHFVDLDDDAWFNNLVAPTEKNEGSSLVVPANIPLQTNLPKGIRLDRRQKKLVANISCLGQRKRKYFTLNKMEEAHNWRKNEWSRIKDHMQTIYVKFNIPQTRGILWDDTKQQWCARRGSQKKFFKIKSMKVKENSDGTFFGNEIEAWRAAILWRQKTD